MARAERRIDHLVHAVHDLDAATDFYRRLGFQVGARNRHSWGTENRLVQFGSSFIELITVGDGPEEIPPHEPGRFSFGAFVRDYLREREGLGMLALDSVDARADAAYFARTGIGAFEPFFFERKGRRPDGSETHVAFTLAFAVDPGLPSTSFFVCQQHFPENFWNPAFQKHPNGATDIRVVTLAAAEPGSHAGFLSAFTGSTADRSNEKRLVLRLRNGGHLAVERRADAVGCVSFAVTVPDLAGQAALLTKAAIRHDVSGESITVRVDGGYGVSIVFASLAALRGRFDGAGERETNP